MTSKRAVAVVEQYLQCRLDVQLQCELHACIIHAAHVFMAEHPRQRALAQVGLPAILTLAWAAWLTLPGQKSSFWSVFSPGV